MRPGCQAWMGVRGQAIRFDGDHGADLPEVFQVDRWNDFSLDFWMRDNARSPQPVVVLQRTFGTDVGYNGFDLMLQDGILEGSPLSRLARQRHRRAVANANRSKRVATHRVTYDGSSTAAGLRLFLNGKQLATDVLRDHIAEEGSACRPTAPAISRSASDFATAASRTASSTSCAFTIAR